MNLELKLACIILGIVLATFIIHSFTIPTHIHYQIHCQSNDNYTVSKLCPDGKTASQEMNRYGDVINLECR